jgi:K+-sensing histidine kinase KdpD
MVATPPATSIDVTCELANNELRLRVRDHGAGIPAGDLPRVFERFYRGRDASHVRASGSGMGLWIAKGLVSAAGGRIWAENCADGGAPVHHRVAARRGNGEAGYGSPMSVHGRILLVDDEIFGQSARTRWELLLRGSTLDKFLSAVPDAAVQVVPLTES